MGKIHRTLLGYSNKRGLAVLHSFKDLESEDYRRQSTEIVNFSISTMNHALSCRSAEQLKSEYEELNFASELRPFYLEGIGMAAAISDNYLPKIVPFVKRNFLESLLETFDRKYHELILFGAGRGMAEVPDFNLYRLVNRYLPSMRWLIIDGYGFQKGFFAIAKDSSTYSVPSFKFPYFERAYVQGLSRCLGFYLADQPDLTANYVNRFKDAKAYDIWSGIGSAVAFLGAVEVNQFAEWVESDPEIKPYLAAGVALAARLLVPAGFDHDMLDAYSEKIWKIKSKDLASRVISLQEHLENTQMPDQSLYDEDTDYQNLRDIVLDEYASESYLQKFAGSIV